MIVDEALAALGISLGAHDALVCALLLAARLGPIAWLAPWIAPTASPAIVRTTTLAALVLALLGIASSRATIPENDPALVLAIARELIIGLCVAIVTSVPIAVFEHVGRSLDAWRPSRQDAEGTYTRLFGALAAAAFVAIGGLRVVMRALGDALVSLPLGHAVTSDATRTMALDTARVLATAVSFTVSLAAPALVALFAAELGIAIAMRAAHFRRTMDKTLGLRAGLVLDASLLAIAASLPELPALTRWAVSQLR